MVHLELHKLFQIARETQKINQTVVADAAGKQQPSLSNFEKGNRTAPLGQDALQKMAPILGINPAYILDQTKNPFSSVNLIKMFFVESLLGNIDYDFIRFLYTSNDTLEFLFLHAPISNVGKILVFLGSSPVYAIAVRDGANNVFIFRRENANIYFGGVATWTGDLELELGEAARHDNKHVSFSRTLIDPDTFKMIKDWDRIAKIDIENLFLPQNQIPLLSEKEYSLLVRLIKAFHDGIVSLHDIEQLIERKTKDLKSPKGSHKHKG